MSSPTDTRAPRDWAHYTEPAVVDVDGLPTAYRRKGSGEPALYLHGGGLTRMWLPFLERLSASHDVIAPEHPGFGDTPLPPGLDGFDDLVLHYDGLLDALGLERVHLVGHSLGGWIAAELAVFYPRRLKSLTLITAEGLRLKDVRSIDTFRMEEEEMMLALFNGRGDRFTEYFEQERSSEGLRKGFQESATLALLAWNPRYDRKLDRRLARVTAPTLVLGVEEDRIVPTEMAARFAELIPGARLEVVGGEPGAPSGHLVNVEQPDRVAALVADHVIANS